MPFAEALATTSAEFLATLGIAPRHQVSKSGVAETAEEISIRRRRLEMTRFRAACDSATIQPQSID